MLKHNLWLPEYEKMFWVCHGSACEVVILLALFNSARNGGPRFFAHVTLDPGSTLHLVSDVLRQEAIETLLIFASLNSFTTKQTTEVVVIFHRFSLKIVFRSENGK